MTHHHGALPKAFCLCLVFAALVGCSPKEDPAAEKVNPETMETQEQAKTAQEPDSLPQEFSPDLTEQPAEDDAFFADAAFLGNSLIDGFQLYSGLTTSDYYCATSMTVSKSEELISQMAQKQYGKVYILLGINEIGYDTGRFIELYQEMLNSIRAQQPNAALYIMGLTPVSAEKSASSDVFTMDRVREYNEALRQLAKDNACYYVDLCQALAGPDGFLPAEATGDGVHFAASQYQIWLDYLKTHYHPEG